MDREKIEEKFKVFCDQYRLCTEGCKYFYRTCGKDNCLEMFIKEITKKLNSH